jgi:Protein of unknown function (DUF1116)
MTCMTADSPADSQRGLVLPDQVRVVNVGLRIFSDAVRAQGGTAVDVDWRIPAGGDLELVAALAHLYGQAAERIDAANTEVLRRLDTATPVAVGVAPAGQVVPGMAERMVLHAGPGLEWPLFCDPLARSVRAAVMAEGWASDPDDAQALVQAGDVVLSPANEHATVGPMATAISPSSPVWVVENPDGGNRAYSGINQGPGKTAWMGVEEPPAVERLRWLREVAGPVLDATLRASGPMDLFGLAAQGLQMGDELHMRVQATTNLLIRHLLPYLSGLDDPRRIEVARFLSANYLFFLNLAMAAAKATVDWAALVRESSIATGMSRNGTTFGVRASGSQRWFVADAPRVGSQLFHGGYGPDDAALDIGDSAVLELVGLGAAAAAASPAVAGFLGGSVAEAVATTQNMVHVCVGRSSRFRLPYLDAAGAPLGVDVRRVVELEMPPSINTGILHASAGLGQVGAGVAVAPLACFQQALRELEAALA